MKSLIATIMLVLLSACASTSYQHKGSVVSGTGRTVEEAKNDAFTRAIEFEVGSALLIEKESRNTSIVRDDIIKYSAGYIESYKVLDQSTYNDKVVVSLEVVVKSSKIHERLLGKGGTGSDFNGDQLSTQYFTYMGERLSGDKYLDAILRDAPTMGYIVTHDKIEFKLSHLREPIIVIPYSVRWNYKYLTALNEALSKLEDGDSSARLDLGCLCYKSPGRIVIRAKDPKALLIGESNTYHFNDAIRARKIQDAFRGGNEVKMRVKILSDLGKPIYNNCVSLSNHFSGLHGNNVYVLWGNVVEEERLNITIRRNTKLINELKESNRIELSMDTAASCAIDFL